MKQYRLNVYYKEDVPLSSGARKVVRYRIEGPDGNLVRDDRGYIAGFSTREEAERLMYQLNKEVKSK